MHNRAEPNDKKRNTRSAPHHGEIILYFGPAKYAPKPRKARGPHELDHAPGWPGKFKYGSGLSFDHVKRQATLVRVEGAVALYRFERDGLVYRVPRAHLKVIDKDTIAVTREWLARASPSGWR